MPERATYTVKLDDYFDKQTPVSPDWDITSYVVNMSFTYGMNAPYQHFAPPARAYITLANDSGDFNPDDTNSKYYNKLFRGQIIRIYMDTGSGNTKIFTGKLTTRDFSLKDFVTLVVEDQMLRMLNTQITPPLQQNVRIDDVIKKVFELRAAIYPYDTAYFALDYSELSSPGGDVGVMQIRENNVLFGINALNGLDAYRNLQADEARTTLDFAGDVTQSLTNAQTYLREIVAAEGGRFFWDAPNEVFRFQNRWANSVNYSVDATLTGTEIESGLFSMDEDLVNDVEITYIPRAVSNATTALYESPNVITLQTGQTLNITANYQDPANPGSTCGGLDPICTIGTDIIINTNQDGSGTNVTAQQFVDITFNATSATFVITSLSSANLYITTLQVRGKPISLLASEKTTYVNMDSVRTYDRYPANISMPTVDNEELAYNIAKLMVLFQGTPLRRFRRVTFWANHNATMLGYAENLRIGDGIQLDYDDHSMKYVIIGQEHQISPGGSNGHKVSLWVQSIQTGNFFTLGTSELNSIDTLAF